MTALARKWRPKKFADYKGQDHVIQSLKHALNNNRMHHAYLFSGTRGVGKTTVARILAKALSCKQGISDNPCQKCEHCLAINDNSYIDLIEVDAASKTKVEDTRELLEHAQFMPHSGKFKIFIIDEAHMLSNHSFNALLKTLEEPPAHVKFLLATTDPDKLPTTILSRCLHFKLLPITPNIITEHLSFVLEQEGIAFEKDAITQIAEHTGGSVRDALSCTDQLIALGAGNINQKTVANLLGLTEPKLISEMMEYIFAGARNQAMELIEQLHAKGFCLKKVLIAITKELHNKLKHCENKAELETAHYYYQIAIIGIRDFSYNPTSLIALNMVIMRMLDFSFKTNSSITTNTSKEKSPVVNKPGNILEQLEVTGMTKAIVKNLEIITNTPELLEITLSEDKKALLTPIHQKKIIEAIKKSGFTGKIELNCGSKSNKSSKLSAAFNGQVLSSSESK